MTDFATQAAERVRKAKEARIMFTRKLGAKSAYEQALWAAFSDAMAVGFDSEQIASIAQRVLNDFKKEMKAQDNDS